VRETGNAKWDKAHILLNQAVARIWTAQSSFSSPIEGKVLEVSSGWVRLQWDEDTVYDIAVDQIVAVAIIPREGAEGD